jgi:hypothetical protein
MFSRLYQIYTLFDVLHIQKVSFHQETPLDYKIDLTLSATHHHSSLPSSTIRLCEHRAPTLKRSFTQKAVSFSGIHLHDLPPPPLPAPLFVQDLHLFYKSLEEKSSIFNLNRLLKTYKMIHLIEEQIA